MLTALDLALQDIKELEGVVDKHIESTVAAAGGDSIKPKPVPKAKGKAKMAKGTITFHSALDSLHSLLEEVATRKKQEVPKPAAPVIAPEEKAGMDALAALKAVGGPAVGGPVEGVEALKSLPTGGPAVIPRETEGERPSSTAPAGGQVEGGKARGGPAVIEGERPSSTAPAGGQVEGGKARGGPAVIEGERSSSTAPAGGQVEGGKARGGPAVIEGERSSSTAPAGGQVEGGKARGGPAVIEGERSSSTAPAGGQVEGGNASGGVESPEEDPADSKSLKKAVTFEGEHEVLSSQFEEDQVSSGMLGRSRSSSSQNSSGLGGSKTSLSSSSKGSGSQHGSTEPVRILEGEHDHAAAVSVGGSKSSSSRPSVGERGGLTLPIGKHLNRRQTESTVESKGTAQQRLRVARLEGTLRKVTGAVSCLLSRENIQGLKMVTGCLERLTRFERTRSVRVMREILGHGNRLSSLDLIFRHDQNSQNHGETVGGSDLQLFIASVLRGGWENIAKNKIMGLLCTGNVQKELSEAVRVDWNRDVEREMVSLSNCEGIESAVSKLQKKLLQREFLPRYEHLMVEVLGYPKVAQGPSASGSSILPAGYPDPIKVLYHLNSFLLGLISALERLHALQSRGKVPRFLRAALTGVECKALLLGQESLTEKEIRGVRQAAADAEERHEDPEGSSSGSEEDSDSEEEGESESESSDGSEVEESGSEREEEGGEVEEAGKAAGKRLELGEESPSALLASTDSDESD